LKTGLRFKLILFFMLVVILPILASATWTFFGVKKQLVDNVYSQNNLIAKRLSDSVDQTIKARIDLVTTLAAMPQVIKMEAAELKPALKAVKNKNADIDVVGVLNLKGVQVARSDDSGLLDLKERSYFKEAIAGKDFVVSEVLISKTTQKPIVVVSSPIKENGSVKGVIHLSLKLDALVDLINGSKAGITGYSFLVDGAGKVVAHPDQQLMADQKDLTSLIPVKNGLSGQTGAAEYSGQDETWLASYTQTPFLKWVVVSQQPMDEATAGANQLVLNTLVVLALGAIFALLVGIVLSNRTVRPILGLKDKVLSMAEGDLTRAVEVKDTDEIGDLARSVEKTRDGLRVIVTQLVDTGDQLYDSAGQLSHQSQQTSAGASEAAAAVSEIAATVEQVSRSLQEVSQASEETAKAAREGSRGVEELTGQMNNITRSSQEASQVINSLNATLNQIHQIVDLITNIADQTNLLALNAAIEAARAGDQGRGFAVVADEVRQLAEQSATAAKNISQMIAQVRVESDKAVSAMAAGTDQVKEGAVVVEGAGRNFRVIMDSVSGLAVQIQSVASAADQVSAGIQNIAATTEEQTAAMEEVAAASEQLTRMSADLKDLAGRFKI